MRLFSMEGFKLELTGQGSHNPSHCYHSEASASNRFPGPAEASQTISKSPEDENGIQDSKSASTGAQLKRLCTNAHSIGNKQELETCTSLQGYDIISITETQWDGPSDWSLGLDRYKLIRKDKGEMETVSPSTSMPRWSPWNPIWGKTANRACGSRFKGRQR